MLIMNKKGTKCKLCGKDLSGTTMQETSYTCSQCGARYEPICGGHLCPKCGGMLQGPWTSWRREHGTNLIF